MKKVAAGLPSKEVGLIRNSLVKNLIFLAAGSQLCVVDYTDIYYSIKKQKTLLGIKSNLKEELLTVVEEIRNQLQDPAFEASLAGSEKQELQRFMNRSDFFMKLVVFYSKSKGFSNPVGKIDPGQEIAFDDLCSLGGFKNLKEMSLEAMSNWDLSPQSANFAFKLLCEQPLVGVTLSSREK